MASSSHQQQINPQPPAPAVHSNQTPISTQSVQQVQDLVDLSEWCNHRVLAKQKNCFVPGVIRTSDIPNSVLVELDHPEGQREFYHDIFGSGKFDVISDASPSLSDVSFFLLSTDRMTTSSLFIGLIIRVNR